jgi:hypothetical protein
MLFFVRDLSIHRFWHPHSVLEPINPGTAVYIYIYIYIYVTEVWALTKGANGVLSISKDNAKRNDP